MLVITRKSEQEVWIGEHVRLKVLAVRGNRVQLGIAAPRDVAVHRAEHFAGGRIAPDDKLVERTEPVAVPA